MIAMFSWPEKDVVEVLDYSLDWSARLGADDTIVTSVWLVPAGLTKTSESKTTSKVTVWISGGTKDTEYIIKNTITTSLGRVIVATAKLTVVEK